MSAQILPFRLILKDRVVEEAIAVDRFVIAGWTGRDKAALEKHIVELEALGVARPASTPIYYRVSAARLTFAEAIECAGGASSGEAEFMILDHGGRRFVGVGSDHTDREVETYGVTVSKQMCDKPIATDLWSFDDVADHWDRLILRSHAVVDGTRVLYQEGPVTAMLPPDVLVAELPGGFASGTAMFCGTLAARGGIRPAERFEFELEDPVLGRRLSHGYDVLPLPIAG